MRFAPHAAARAHGAGEENYSSPGSSVVNCAIGIPSTERPECRLLTANAKSDACSCHWLHAPPHATPH